jgi:putative ABC transport system substrate-binding protein
MGYVENRNVAIEYRYADGQRERLAAFAAELARHQVAVIYAIPTAAAVAAKGATSTIPIVFAIGDDPVAAGLVASFNRPGGNVTGFTGMRLGLFGKQLGMPREAVPKAGRIAVLVNPTNPVPTSTVADAKEAAAVIGLPIEVLTATTIVIAKSTRRLQAWEETRARYSWSRPILCLYNAAFRSSHSP